MFGTGFLLSLSALYIRFFSQAKKTNNPGLKEPKYVKSEGYAHFSQSQL